VLEFIRSQTYAVEATVSPSGTPQAAVVGFVVTNNFELFFDTLDSTRKAQNLRLNPHVAFVIGGLQEGDERTVQFQGVADFPGGAELERLKELYFSRFPDGRARAASPDLIYLRALPMSLRFSDFSRAPPEITEFEF